MKVLSAPVDRLEAEGYGQYRALFETPMAATTTK